MAFDFPASPANGDLYQPAGGQTYRWDGQKWAMASSPIQTPAYVRRNRVVNPSMQISQENGTTAGSTSAFYAADQWVGNIAAGVATSQLVVLSGPTPNRLRYTVTTGAAMPAGSSNSIQTKIEGLNLVDLNWGASPAIPVVVRFLLKAPAGTYALSIRNAVPDRTYAVNFTVSAGQANTDVVWTFAIPGDVTGTWPKDNSLGMYLQVGFAVASDRQGVTGWQAGNFASAAGVATSSTTGNIFELSDIGLYADPQGSGLAPAYEAPAYASELLACQRYYAKTFSAGVNPAQAAGANGALLATSYAAGGAGSTWKLPVEMRTVPTVTSYNPTDATSTWRDVTNSLDKTFSLGVASTGSISANASGTAATAAYNYVHMVASARM